MKKIIALILGVAVVGATQLPLGSEVIDLPWHRSYETIAFETADGDLGMNEWATDGSTYYYRTVPKDEGIIEGSDDVSVTEGKTEVSIRGMKSASNPTCIDCAYYDEFVNPEGGIYRRPSDKIKYKETKTKAPKETAFRPIKTAHAAIAFDTDTDQIYNFVSSITFNHTTTGTDTVIAVIIGMDDSSDTDRDVAASTYNGDALAEGHREDYNALNGTTEVWYAAPADTGTNSVYVETVGVITDGYVNVITLTGVDQTNPKDSSNGASVPNTTTPTYTIVTVAADAWIVDGATQIIANANCVPTTQTETLDAIDGSFRLCAGYEGPKGAAGSKTVGWTCDSGAGCTAALDWALAGVSFKPAAAAAASPEEVIIWFE